MLSEKKQDVCTCARVHRVGKMGRRQGERGGRREEAGEEGGDNEEEDVACMNRLNSSL